MYKSHNKYVRLHRTAFQQQQTTGIVTFAAETSRDGHEM